ncbi:MAG: SGNH/GDSL hydrolase family protein [bacterium]
MKLLKIILINILFIFVVLFLLEISFRIYNKIIGKSISDGFVIDDEKYGWSLNLNFKERPIKNKCGEEVIMKPPKHNLIIKFPKYEDAKKTVLFIGDSYTHAHEVSSGSAYHDVFEEMGKGKYRVFTVAIGGFGTMQQYMFLKDVYEEIKPDYIIWQMCSNDIENNVFELDNASFFNNQRRRPYYDLETEKIEIKNPGFWLFDLSQGFWFVFPKIVAFDYKYRLGIMKFLNSFVELDEESRVKFERQGFEITEVLIKKVVNDFPESTLIGFSANELYDEEFKQIFEKNGAFYWGDFAKFMDTHEKYNCAPYDAHWNHYGNVVAGEKLFELFEEFLQND